MDFSELPMMSLNTPKLKFSSPLENKPLFSFVSQLSPVKKAQLTQKEIQEVTIHLILGFAIKFYTEEGNWDMTGNNTPVFFIRDPIKFPDFIHTQKKDPRTNLGNPTAVWDFWGLSP